MAACLAAVCPQTQGWLEHREGPQPWNPKEAGAWPQASAAAGLRLRGRGDLGTRLILTLGYLAACHLCRCSRHRDRREGRKSGGQGGEVGQVAGVRGARFWQKQGVSCRLPESLRSRSAGLWETAGWTSGHLGVREEAGPDILSLRGVWEPSCLRREASGPGPRENSNDQASAPAGTRLRVVPICPPEEPRLSQGRQKAQMGAPRAGAPGGVGAGPAHCSLPLWLLLCSLPP